MLKYTRIKINKFLDIVDHERFNSNVAEFLMEIENRGFA